MQDILGHALFFLLEKKKPKDLTPNALIKLTYANLFSEKFICVCLQSRFCSVIPKPPKHARKRNIYKTYNKNKQ